MLDLIACESSVDHLYNCEIVPEVYKTQASKNIKLIGGDVLELPFKNKSFDYVIIKNLLHHLVGKSRKRSKENAKKAIKELVRVLKDGRYIIVLEQYNEHRTSNFIIFYLSLFFSLFNFGCKALHVPKNVIVSYLTSHEIKHLLRETETKIILSKQTKLKLGRILAALASVLTGREMPLSSYLG